MRVIRIRVIEGSKLLLILCVALLLTALFAVALRYVRADSETGAFTETFATGLVRASEAEAATALAAAASAAETRAHALWRDLRAQDGFEIEVLPPEASPAPSISPAKRVLIYHTHTHEAYEETADDPYIETEHWRTNDPDHSVVRVGDALADALRALNVTVVHDKTDHEPPKLGTAYERSLKTLEKYARQGFDLYIDLHRDAYSEQIQDARAVSIGGVSSAQLMVLIGNGQGFSEKPDTGANLAFARALTAALNELYPGICRDVLVKNGRYNQHVASPCILIEAGHNLNTLKEALAAMPTLAAAIESVLRKR